MVTLMLIGQAVFIAASFALGAKLLLLWRRTRQVPELCIGLSSLFGGGVGYVSWLVLAILTLREASPVAIRIVVLYGLACSCFGAIALGLGSARIFRPAARWPRYFIGALALVMIGCWALQAAEEMGRTSLAFWVALSALVPIYAWSSIEALLLAQVLHKRARIGLSDPVVVHRTAQWGVSNAAAVLMTLISIGARIAYGPELPTWASMLNACVGLAASGAIWLGFFPPAPVRQRLARAYGS